VVRPRLRPSLVVALVIGVLVGVPIIVVFINSFNVARLGEATRFGLDNWSAAFGDRRVWQALGTSFGLVITRNAMALPIALGLAWLIARTDMPGRRLLELILWLSIFLPALPMAFGWILLLDNRNGLLNDVLEGIIGVRPFDIYGFWGITWVSLTTTAVGYKVILLLPFLRRLSPVLEEAAQTSGASRWATMRRVTLPLLMPAVLGILFLSIVIGLAGFEIELLLGRPANLFVFSTLIYDLVRDPQPAYGMATVLGFFLVITMLGLAIFHRFYIARREVATVTGRGFVSARIHLGRWRYPAAALAFGWILVSLLVPLVLLVLGSFMRRYGFFDIPNPLTLANWQGLFADPFFPGAIVNSLILGGSVAVGSILLYSVVGYVIVRFPGRTSDFVDVLSWLPWAIPGILMGLAMLWLLLASPFKGVPQLSLVAMIVALIIQDSPRSTLLFKTATMQVGRELEESAAASGAKWRSMYRRILLPLLAPAALTVGVLTFLSAIRDISTPVLLYSSATRPIAILMLEYARSALFERAVALGVLLAGVVLVITFLALRFGLTLEEGPRYRVGRRHWHFRRGPRGRDAPDSTSIIPPG
jgi:iron(III) transport system permease protein